MFSKGSKQEAEGNQPTPVVKPISAAPMPPKPIRTGKVSMPSIVSEGMHVTGNMICDGDLQVDGTVEGDVKGRNLTVGSAGTVTGKLVGDQVDVHGSVTGEIRAQVVSIAKTGKVVGDVTHESIAIEAGAIFEGMSRRISSSQTARAGITDTTKQVFQQLMGNAAVNVKKP
ncbi:MAG: polymer-forming cytoskeletal protein [Alphaproteobacteria bacterium]